MSSAKSILIIIPFLSLINACKRKNSDSTEKVKTQTDHSVEEQSCSSPAYRMRVATVRDKILSEFSTTLPLSAGLGEFPSTQHCAITAFFHTQGEKDQFEKVFSVSHKKKLTPFPYYEVSEGANSTALLMFVLENRKQLDTNHFDWQLCSGPQGTKKE